MTSPVQLLKSYQSRVYRDDSRFIAWIAGRQVGKSFTGAMRAVKMSDLRKKNDFLIASPSERQSLEAVEKCRAHVDAFNTVKIAEEIVERDAPGALMKSSTIIFENGSRIIAVPGKPDTVRGFSADIWMDEFAFFEDPAATASPDGLLPNHYTRRILHDMKLLHELPLRFDPGTGGWYANVNIMTPALIIERVTGRDFADYMRDEVFAPMGMTSTLVDEPGRDVPGRVTGYELDDKGEMVPTAPIYGWMKGAGDLIGTVDDVYCLNKAIKHRKVLRPETWEMALTPDPHSSMGMGCTVTEWHGKHRITHNGGHKGFRTFHVQLPDDDFDVIILSNSGYGDARNAITEIVHDEFYGEDKNLGYIPEWDRGFAK